MNLWVEVDRNGHLLVAARGARKPTVSLCFAEGGMAIEAPGCAPAVLPWDAYGAMGSIMDGGPARDGWAIAPWTVGRWGPIGIALRVSGSYEQMTAPHRKACSTLLRRANGSTGTTLTGVSLLVLRESTRTSSAEFFTTVALCKLLHRQPALRPRLERPQRMRRLASDLSTGMAEMQVAGDGVGRDSTDIHVAMRQAGFVHEYGRPLTRTGLPPLDRMVREVVARLEANPYREGREIDLGQVVQIVKHDYLDIAPWPFAALVED